MPSSSAAGLSCRREAQLLDLPLPALIGRHQIVNAGTAVAAALQLRAQLPASRWMNGRSRRVSTTARWPARMQRLDSGPLPSLLKPGSELWLDGGHNPAAGRALAQTLADLEERSPKPVHLIVGMMGLKDAAGFLAPFRGLARHVVTVPIPGAHEAPHAPETLAETARKVGLEAEWQHGRRERVEALRQDRSGAEAHPDLRLALSCRPRARAAGGRRAPGELTCEARQRAKGSSPSAQNKTAPSSKLGAVAIILQAKLAGEAQATLAELIQSSSFFFCTRAPVCCAAT